MSNLDNEVKRPDNDKDVLDAIFSAIHPEQGFFKFIDITFHKLRWKLTSDDYNYFKNILLETGYFTQEFIAADGYNHNNSMPDIRLKPITKYLKAIHAAGSYSKYIFNNGMKTSAETLNIILTQLATRPVYHSYPTNELSNDVGFSDEIINGAKVILQKDGYISGSKGELTLNDRGLFFIKHEGYDKNTSSFSITNIDNSMYIGRDNNAPAQSGVGNTQIVETTPPKIEKKKWYDNIIIASLLKYWWTWAIPAAIAGGTKFWLSHNQQNTPDKPAQEIQKKQG